MIQLGGLGIMTFSTFFIYLLGGRISFGSRDLLQETLSQAPGHNLKALLITVFRATAVIEGVGALLLTLRFLIDMPLPRALYYGIFHSISAFCNAGFALFPDSFVSYQGDVTVNLIVTSLIILGGLGFVVVFEISRLRKVRLQRRSYWHNLWVSLSLHSRLVLFTTAILIASGFVFFLLFEYNNAIENLPWGAKLLTSYFQSVTARTAGFNTLAIGTLTNPTLLMLIVFMIVGASPGSCGGGIKTTTFAIVSSLISSRIRDREEINLFHRRVPREVVSKAIAITFFSFTLVLVFTMLLLTTEVGGISHETSRGLFLEILFEVSSAFGTVGLSTGTTPTLSPVGRLLITLLMFIGRLGPLTIAMAVGGEKRARFKYAQENILVG